MKKAVLLAVSLLSASILLTGCDLFSSPSSSKSTSQNHTITSTTVSSSPASTMANRQVTDITYDATGHSLNWAAVTGAESYKITITPVGGAAENHTASDHSYSLNSGYTSNFSVSIKAVDVSGIESKPGTRSFTYLVAPVSFTYTYGTVTWEAVPNATSYDVYVNSNVPVNVTKNEYQITSGTTKYSIKVLAKGTDTEATAYYSYVSKEVNYDVLPSPVINFAKSTCTISWDSVAGCSGYYMEILLNSVEVFHHAEGFGKDATTTSFAFGDAGIYTIKLAAKSDKTASSTQDSTFTTYQVTRLSDPSDIGCTEGDSNISIKYDGVLHADGYVISKDGTALGTVDKTSYDFPLTSTSENEEAYTFAVRATSTAPNILDSINAATISVTKLATPQNVRIENGTILWDAVNKAINYEVSIDGNVYTTTTNSYTIASIGEGTHTLKVRSIGDHKTILASKWANGSNIVKLKAPTNLQINKSHTLTWDAVSSATSYKVITDNGTKSENAVGASYNVPTITSSTTLTVKAVGDGGFVMDSDLSSPMSLYTLNAPTGLAVNNGQITWNPVEHASSYTVTVGSYVEEATGTSLALDTYAAQNYAIKVKAIGQGVYFDSVYSTPMTVTILPTVDSISFSAENGISWVAVSQATGYRVFVDGVTHDVAYDVLSYKPNFITSGTHTVKVRALGDDTSKILPSEWKETTTTAQLLSAPANMAVSRTDKGVLVTADIDSHASAFVVSYGGTEHSATTGSVEIPTTTAGTNDVYCYCKGDGTIYVDSEHTSTVKVTVLAAPSKDSILFKKDTADPNLYNVSWADVTGAEAYMVKIRKYTSDTAYTDYAESKQDTASIPVDTTGIVKITVSIKAISSDSLTLASDYTSATSYVS
jgi:hypothetical protein